MNKIFYIQLITSFIAGGVFIAFLTFIAEKVSVRFSGIILSLPSTAALGFLFLGWVLSPGEVADIVPSILIPLGLTALFPALYIYIAEFLDNLVKVKTLQIGLSCVLSILIWFILSLPVTMGEFNDLLIGLIGYIFLVALSHLLLNRKHYKKPLAQSYTLIQKIGRSVFAGFIIVLVLVFGKILNPFLGGLVAVFPTAFVSSLLILHKYYKPKELLPTFRRVPLGTITLLVYSIIVMITFPELGIILGTIISYVASLVVSLLLSKIPIENH